MCHSGHGAAVLVFTAICMQRLPFSKSKYIFHRFVQSGWFAFAGGEHIMCGGRSLGCFGVFGLGGSELAWHHERGRWATGLLWSCPSGRLWLVCFGLRCAHQVRRRWDTGLLWSCRVESSGCGQQPFEHHVRRRRVSGLLWSAAAGGGHILCGGGPLAPRRVAGWRLSQPRRVAGWLWCEAWLRRPWRVPPGVHWL